MKANQPRTIVPGARRAVDDDGKPAFNKHGKRKIPLWDMLEPIYFDRHFKNAGIRRLAEAELQIDEDEDEKAQFKSKKLIAMLSPNQLDRFTVEIPVYRGLDAKTANHMRSQHRRAVRLAQNDKSTRTSALDFISDLTK